MSKFFKGVGIGAGLVAAAGVVGASYIAAKKIKESDKKINEIIKESLPKRKKICTCKSADMSDFECSCHSDLSSDSNDISVDDEIIDVHDIDLNEITQDDYIESLIQERDRLIAENEELKAKNKKNKRS